MPLGLAKSRRRSNGRCCCPTQSNDNPEPTWEIFPTNGPLFPSFATIESAQDAFKSVISDVGANQPVLDDHDSRVVEETRLGTYQYKGSVSGISGLPDRESDVGGLEDYPALTRPNDYDTDGDGLPNFWEDYIGTDPNSSVGDFGDSNGDPDGDGYTNLEDYLHWLALPRLEVENPGSATLDLATLFRGFTESPTFEASSTDCVATSLQGSTLTVTATAAPCLGYVQVSVTDQAGSSMAREVGVYVTQ